MKYIVQIDMAEFGEPAIWQDVAGAEFSTMTQALAHIAWMKKEYGQQIKFTFRSVAPITSTASQYEAMCITAAKLNIA